MSNTDEVLEVMVAGERL